jgi:hypothetical protein
LRLVGGEAPDGFLARNEHFINCDDPGVPWLVAQAKKASRAGARKRTAYRLARERASERKPKDGAGADLAQFWTGSTGPRFGPIACVTGLET